MSNASGGPQAYLTVIKFRDNAVLLSGKPNGLRPLYDWNTVFKAKVSENKKKGGGENSTHWDLIGFTFITLSGGYPPPKRVKHRV
jgi:hypothetical protein